MVCQVIWWRLARMVALKVEPLFPPKPTIMRLEERVRPLLTELRAIRNAPSLGDLALSLQLDLLSGGSDDVLAIGDIDASAAVDELGGDELVDILIFKL